MLCYAMRKLSSDPLSFLKLLISLGLVVLAEYGFVRNKYSIYNAECQ